VPNAFVEVEFFITINLFFLRVLQYLFIYLFLFFSNVDWILLCAFKHQLPKAFFVIKKILIHIKYFSPNGSAHRGRHQNLNNTILKVPCHAI